MLKKAVVLLALGSAFSGMTHASVKESYGFESGGIDGFTLQGNLEITPDFYPPFSQAPEGNKFAVLSSNDFSGFTDMKNWKKGIDTSAYGGSDGTLFSKTFNVSAGDTLSFSWGFFSGDQVVGDYGNDFAAVFIGNQRYELTDNKTVGGEVGSFKWWSTFSWNANTSYTQPLTVSWLISNRADDQLASHLLLDDIKLTSVSPVPEPSTYATMLLGLGFLGFVAKRKKA